MHNGGRDAKLLLCSVHSGPKRGVSACHTQSEPLTATCTAQLTSPPGPQVRLGPGPADLEGTAATFSPAGNPLTSYRASRDPPAPSLPGSWDYRREHRRPVHKASIPSARLVTLEARLTWRGDVER
jgi:hypothetical protein